MSFRREFREAIALLARAVTLAAERGAGRPILVGGAAVELYTSGAITSGDFDLVTPDDEKLAAALEQVGFQRRPSALNQLVHPELQMAVEFVSGPLMDGKADLARLYVFQVGNDRLNVVPVEDLIADRLGQAFSDPTPRKDMLDQARKLFQLAESIDRDYLKKRIAEETANAADLEILDQS
jgi:hypothetical protein